MTPPVLVSTIISALDSRLGAVDEIERYRGFSIIGNGRSLKQIRGICWRADENEGGTVEASLRENPKQCKVVVCSLHGGGVHIPPYLY